MSSSSAGVCRGTVCMRTWTLYKRILHQQTRGKAARRRGKRGKEKKNRQEARVGEKTQGRRGRDWVAFLARYSAPMCRLCDAGDIWSNRITCKHSPAQFVSRSLSPPLASVAPVDHPRP